MDKQTIEIDASLLVTLVQRVERSDQRIAHLERCFDEFLLQRREVAIIEQRHIERARGMESRPEKRK